jgi:hypothetical protein
MSGMTSTLRDDTLVDHGTNKKESIRMKFEGLKMS